MEMVWLYGFFNAFARNNLHLYSRNVATKRTAMSGHDGGADVALG